MSNIATAGNLTAFHNWTLISLPRPGPVPIDPIPWPLPICPIPAYTRYTHSRAGMHAGTGRR